MAKKIFINYRRDDSQAEARNIYLHLEKRLGRKHIFMDVDALAAGADFTEVVDKHISQCGAVLALIGPGWFGAGGANGERRLDDTNDFVRIEIASALKRNVPVIPVLLGNAAMPSASDLPEDLQPLASRNAFRVTQENFATDMLGLVQAVEQIVGRRRSRVPLVSFLVFALLASCLAYGWFVWLPEQKRLAEEAAKRQETAAWQKAIQTPDREARKYAITRYVENYPSGAFVDKANEEVGKIRAEEAKERERRLAESIDWSKAQDEQSSDQKKRLLQNYLSRWPQGQHTVQARQELDKIVEKEKAQEKARLEAADAAAWERASKDGKDEERLAQLQSYISEYSDGKHASQARQEVARIETRLKIKAENERKAKLLAEQKKVEAAFWKAIKKKDNSDYFTAYLEQYPKGEFVGEAQKKQAQLLEAQKKFSTGELLEDRYSPAKLVLLTEPVQVWGSPSAEAKEQSIAKAGRELIVLGTVASKKWYKVATSSINSFVENGNVGFVPATVLSKHLNPDDVVAKQHIHVRLRALKDLANALSTINNEKEVRRLHLAAVRHAAVAQKGDDFYGSLDQGSEEEANKGALESCGGGSCKVVVSFYFKSCFALYRSKRSGWAWAVRSNIKEATSAAHKNCISKNKRCWKSMTFCADGSNSYKK